MVIYGYLFIVSWVLLKSRGPGLTSLIPAPSDKWADTSGYSWDWIVYPPGLGLSGLRPPLSSPPHLPRSERQARMCEALGNGPLSHDLWSIIGSHLTDAVIYIQEVSEKGGKITIGKGNWGERKESYKTLANAENKSFWKLSTNPKFKTWPWVLLFLKVMISFDIVLESNLLQVWMSS